MGSGDSFQYGGKGFVHGYDNTNSTVILVVLLDISFLLNYKWLWVKSLTPTVKYVSMDFSKVIDILDITTLFINII